MPKQAVEEQIDDKWNPEARYQPFAAVSGCRQPLRLIIQISSKSYPVELPAQTPKQAQALEQLR